MGKSPSTTHTGQAHERVLKRLDKLVAERTAFGEAFAAYIKGTLTSDDCTTLVDGVLRQLVEDAKLSRRNAVLLEVVTDAVAQLANRDSVR